MKKMRVSFSQAQQLKAGFLFILKSVIILYLTGILLILNGCMTINVRNIGVTAERLQAQKVLQCQDGSIAIIAQRNIEHEYFLNVVTAQRDEIIAGSKAVVSSTMSSGINTNGRTGDGKIILYIDLAEQENAGWHVSNKGSVDDDTFFSNACSPYTIMQTSDPKNVVFNGDDHVYSIKGIRFTEKGATSYEYVRTRFWHYPSQILLPLAIVYDIATSPIQWVMIVYKMLDG